MTLNSRSSIPGVLINTQGSADGPGASTQLMTGFLISADEGLGGYAGEQNPAWGRDGLDLPIPLSFRKAR